MTQDQLTLISKSSFRHTHEMHAQENDTALERKAQAAHRIPLDAADAGDQPLILLRQHVLQAVAGLVEQRFHLLQGTLKPLGAPSDILCHMTGMTSSPVCVWVLGAMSCTAHAVLHFCLH